MTTNEKALQEKVQGEGQKRSSTDSTTKTASANPYDANLLPEHEQIVSGSAISPEVAQTRRYRSVAKKVELKCLGFSDRQCRVPAILIPVWNIHGEIATYQIRPNDPRVEGKRGRMVKYETPGKSRMVIDVPPLIRDKLR